MLTIDLDIGPEAGQWVEVEIPTGEVLRLRVLSIRTGRAKTVRLGFDGDRDTFRVGQRSPARRPAPAP